MLINYPASLQTDIRCPKLVWRLVQQAKVQQKTLVGVCKLDKSETL